ncbi:hypothetical protein J2Z44_003310 [Clostridium punense]|uniref:Uncharacterized protein n=1 Tax=Clostridium punense TaxID=1054297 RepID=A0ABS4K6Q4_9CLOT|nr:MULTISPECIES: hypothetical protein [Clostridium]EQB89832.1 hypothetical protein M918_18745 [Clostridium sp. BL8]MBP2023473.1 hypothetical protein [Clostridium punense]
MSAFLAPIHSWLFNKVLLFQDIEMDLRNKYLEIYGEEAREIIEETKNYGELIDRTKSIEELIDLSNIHGWLQNKIQNGESRVAVILSIFIDKYGSDALKTAEDIFYNNGIKQGQMAKEKENPQNAKDIFSTLNNYILEGMPCDRVQKLIQADEHIVRWINTSCVHRGNFERANADINLFYKLRFLYLKGFVSSANEEYKFFETNNEDDYIYNIEKA